MIALTDWNREPTSDLNVASPMNNTLRGVTACVALLFFSAIIVYLIGWGDSDNSLHGSALGWAFLGDLGVLAGLSILVALPQLRK